MKTVQDIYTEYTIMPSLQLHQLRVAAVGKMICESTKVSVDARDVTLACLFHDMGNIIKSDLAYFPDFVEPQGLEYWQNVKKDFIAKYGEDQHIANPAIAKEIGLPERVIDLIDGIGYSKLPQIVAGSDVEQKISEYADTRVGPHGVLPLKERMLEGKRRFDAKNMRGTTPYYRDSEFERLVDVGLQLEHQIFTDTKITPEVITDESTKNMIEELRKFPVA